MATLKRNGISATIYRWFYGLELYELPKNLCPYFWKSVLMYLIIIPYIVLCLPICIWEIFDKSYKHGDRVCGERIAYSILFYIGCIMLIALLSSVGWLFVNYTIGSFFYVMGQAGITFWILGLGFGIWRLVRYIKNKAFKSKHIWNEEKGEYVNYTPTMAIIIEMITATYHKYCPELKWK
jgi:uncharacterized Tic20 family protein